ncbi:hypothetical protein Avbf_15700 [Armadillidium vulgare]|nr:hypothetical protein Avbf_15700 [Armadillidium vulgare]
MWTYLLLSLFNENSFKIIRACPNCRAEIKGTESLLPINYNTLKVVDIYKSKNWSESEMDIKKKCVERKEILSKFLHYVFFGSSGRVSRELEEDFKKNNGYQRLCDDLKSTVSILLSDFQDSQGYLEEIYKRIYNEEKIFAVRKVEDKIKYGKVSKYENKLFFHSLSLSEVPTDSSLIWFDDLKECVTDTNFYTFLEICCNNKRLTRLAIIKMFDKQQSHHFIKMCTGEYGPSLKEASFEKGDDSKNFKSVLHIEKCRKCSRLLEYNFTIENKLGFINANLTKCFFL